MQKLAAADPAAIVSAYHRGEGVPAIAARYGISRERVYQILRYTRKHGSPPVLKRPGRRPRPPPWDAMFFVLGYRRMYQLGPRTLSRCITRETACVIPHTMVYRILHERGLITAQKRKPPRPTWVRFEPAHAMSLWQGDWKQVTIDGQIQWLIAFLVDASRFVTRWGGFPHATTEATILVLETGFARYGVPNEILTDHGSQFVSNKKTDTPHHAFGRFLDHHHIRHIVARRNHPQTNGTIERFFREIDRLIAAGFSMDEIIDWQNTIKPHASLD
jgi:putative transposase